MKELRENFLEELKYNLPSNNNVDETFFENVKKYLILNNSINFDDNSTISKEKQYIENVLQ